MAAKPVVVSAFDVRDYCVLLAERDSAAFCRLLYELSDDLKGTRYREAGPYARAAVEAGSALADAAFRYGREADHIDEMAGRHAAA